MSSEESSQKKRDLRNHEGRRQQHVGTRKNSQTLNKTMILLTIYYEIAMHIDVHIYLYRLAVPRNRLLSFAQTIQSLSFKT